MYCENCNKRIEKEWRYCPHCGNQIKLIKLNVSTTTVVKEVILNCFKKKEFCCGDIEICDNIDCDECIFDTRTYTLEELKDRLIKEV